MNDFPEQQIREQLESVFVDGQRYVDDKRNLGLHNPQLTINNAVERLRKLWVGEKP